MPLISFLRRAAVALGAVSVFAAAQVQAQAPSQAPLPIASFFRAASFSSAQLSPDGRNLAFRVSVDDGPVMLGVMALETRAPQIIVRGTSDVGEVRWVSNKRLAYTLNNRGRAPGENDLGPGLFAIDIDGKDARQLATRNVNIVSNDGAIGTRMLPPGTYMNASLGKQDSDTIYVNVLEDNRREVTAVNLARLDTRTGRIETLSRPGATFGWMLDEQAEPRIAITREEYTSVINYRDPADGKWRKVASYDGQSKDAIEPLAFGPDGKLYVAARNGQDKAALYVYDIQAGKLQGEPIVRLQNYDFDGGPIFRNNKLAGVRYLGDAQAQYWLDEDIKKLQAYVDEKLPATNNLLSWPRRAETPYMLVTAYSDVEPGATYLLNAQTREMALLGRSLPDLPSARLATMDAVRLKARDGLEIPAWLTLPKNAKKNLPMVVLVHGGPWVRGGQWGFSRDAQFLASRGYAVLEPEFRGSVGFGWKHFELSFKQWGQAMQDDVTDATKWAIAQGIADPKRICIAGASYGGYATLMGMIKEPELYRCGINWVGVSDIKLLYDAHWSDSSDVYKKYGMPKLVGDKEKDAEMIKQYSPLQNAAKLTRPLLMAYGASDVRVPLEHGTYFRDAVMRTNPDVEFVAYEGEGHGFRLLKNQVDFWHRVEKFLDRNIGPQAK